MPSISIYSLQAAESNSPSLSPQNLRIGLPSAFRLAAYFLSRENASDFFFNRYISVRSVKSFINPNSIREPSKLRVILPLPKRSPWDSSFFWWLVCTGPYGWWLEKRCGDVSPWDKLHKECAGLLTFPITWFSVHLYPDLFMQAF